MTDKRDKFGIKFWLAVDVELKYISKAIPYLGKDEARPATQRLPDNVVINIVEPYLGKGRNVTTYNFWEPEQNSCREPEQKDVTCREPEQNPKESSATGKRFMAEQIIQQTLANKKRQQLSHNLDSLPVQTKTRTFVFLAHSTDLLWSIKQQKKKAETLTF